MKLLLRHLDRLSINVGHASHPHTCYLGRPPLSIPGQETETNRLSSLIHDGEHVVIVVLAA